MGEASGRRREQGEAEFRDRRRPGDLGERMENTEEEWMPERENEKAIFFFFWGENWESVSCGIRSGLRAASDHI